MTTKYFDNRQITIIYDIRKVSIIDKYNGFMFTMDSNMKKYFVPYIEKLYKLCRLFKRGSIPTHKYTQRDVTSEALCNVITNYYRGSCRFDGNYMDINRKDKIVSAFKECFKRVKEKDIDLIGLDLKRFDLKALLYIKRGLL